MNGKRTEYTFKGVRSLVLDCQRGGDRTWKARYVVYEGGRRTFRRQALGRLHPEGLRRLPSEQRAASDFLTPGQAKDAAEALLSNVRKGADPWLEERHKKRGKANRGMTLEAAYRGWRDDPKRRRSLAARTRDEYDRIFRLYVADRLGHVSVESITRQTVDDLLEAVRRQTTDRQRKRGLQATKVLAILKPVFRWLEGEGVLHQNVVRLIPDPVPKENPNGKIHRPITDEELRRVWMELPKHVSPQTLRLIRLSILLGKRISELTGALREEVDLKAGTWVIPGDREGNKSKVTYTVPLPPLAVSILSEAMIDAGPSKFVFPKGSDSSAHVARSTPSRAWTRLRRRLGVTEASRLHDTRGYLNDLMAKLGVPNEYRSHVLQHTTDMKATLAQSTYSTYDYINEKRRALTLCEMRIKEIIDGKAITDLTWQAPN